MKKNQFNTSFGINQSANLGLITPYAFQEIIPGDEIPSQTRLTIKFAPMVGPVVGLFKLRHLTAFVPYKLIFDDFETYYTREYTAAPPELGPYRAVDPNAAWTMADFWRYHMPLNSNAGCSYPMDMLPVRAYQKIYFDYFLKMLTGTYHPQEQSYFVKTFGADATTSIHIWNAHYSEDFFQNAIADQFYSTFPALGGAAFTLDEFKTWLANARDQNIIQQAKFNFPEYVKALFGLSNQDLRGLTGRAQIVQYNESYFAPTEIVNTALTATAPLGAPGSVVSLTDSNINFNFKSNEHGILMYIIVVEPIPATIGTRRELFAKDKYGVYNPSFESLGNLPIPRYEVAKNPTAANQNDPMGYQPIYNHLRTTRSFIGAEFTDTTPSQLVVRKTLAPTGITDLTQITASDFNYLFASYSLPQVRLYGYTAQPRSMRVLRKPIATAPDITNIL